uniref:U20-theraphotoxin-Cg1a 1 n=1 Tax=Chilobrachys guangxiensis TaxID=278060 RepID=JZ35A_CHIGU|nr:RecName: Full=U20-theraphotoxin-Cg1a 1; Short=U20-TRTX-Cg1a; AltName: Full=Jingzhaotoxin-35; Short=JZTX-35; AltName: Full=Peptide F3-18.97; Flags: Precursor [Chilobrachys guangxiensis]ABY71709.1 cystine knot toxin [Chilobrachys guangxiensis]
MKVSVLITLAVLGVMFVWTSAAELEERGSDQPAWLKSLERIFQSEERDCRALYGGCTKDEDCCKHLACRRTLPTYCAWDLTFP